MEPERVGHRLGAMPRIALLIGCLLASLMVAACAADATPSLIRTAVPETLTGTTWTAVLVGTLPTVTGSEPTASFGSSDVKGSTGCNTYSGSYQYAEGVIKITDVMSTLMGCIGPAGAGETRFMTALTGASSASMDPDGRLVLQGSGGSIAFVVGPVSVPAASG